MDKILFNLPAWQKGFLKDLSERTDLRVSDILRRMIETCSREDVLCEIFPSFSGSLSLGRK